MSTTDSQQDIIRNNWRHLRDRFSAQEHDGYAGSGERQSTIARYFLVQYNDERTCLEANDTMADAVSMAADDLHSGWVTEYIADCFTGELHRIRFEVTGLYENTDTIV